MRGWIVALDVVIVISVVIAFVWWWRVRGRVNDKFKTMKSVMENNEQIMKENAKGKGKTKLLSYI